MPKPRFTVRTFLIVCLVLGAVGIPGTWKHHQDLQRRRIRARAAKISAAKFKVKLALRDYFTAIVEGQSGGPLHLSDPNSPERIRRIRAADERLRQLQAELAELKGRRDRGKNEGRLEGAAIEPTQTGLGQQ